MPPRPLPDAMQLAALGSVLCLYRDDDAPTVHGWWAAAHADVHACVDASGAREWVSVHGAPANGLPSSPAARHDRMRLYLLPDTDFLAWERMTATLAPATERDHSAAPLHARLFTRLAASVRRMRWRALPLRLLAQPQSHADRWRLTALPAALSPLGHRVATHIARCEGADFLSCPDPERSPAVLLDAFETPAPFPVHT